MSDERQVKIGDMVIDMSRFSEARQRLWRILRFAIGGLLLLILATTSYYQVEPDEVAVIQRFGAYARTEEPGLHVRIPFGVESVTKVPVQRQLKMEFGFRTLQAGVQTTYAPASNCGPCFVCHQRLRWRQ